MLDGTQLPSPKGAHPTIFGPYPLRPIGCVDQDATWYGGRPRPRRLCVRWRPRSSSPKKGRSPLPNFWARVYCGQTAGWIKMVLGMEVGLSPVDFVLDGGPSPLYFRPMFIIVIVISLEHCTGVRRYWFVQVQVQYSMHSIFRKFNHTQFLRYAQLRNHADSWIRSCELVVF